MQKRLVSLIHGFPQVMDVSRRMLRGMELLDVPVIVTEQYPKAFGPTVSELADAYPRDTTVLAKTQFSMFTPEVDGTLKRMPNVKQVVLVGIETHVCVLQTALDLLHAGYEVHLIVDGVSSQRALDRAVALKRMAQAGVYLSTCELALFQMLRDAKHTQLKAVSALMKEARGTPIPFTASM